MRYVVVFAFLCMATAPCSLAFPARQDSERSDVVLTVKEPGGMPIPKAQVQIVPLPPNTKKSLMTDADGKLHLTMPPGDYDLVVTFPGFKRATEHLELQRRVSRAVDVVLQIGDMCPPGCPPIVTPQKVIGATGQRMRPPRARRPFAGSEIPGHSAGLPVKLQLLLPASEALRSDGTEAIDFMITNIGHEPIEVPSSVSLVNSAQYEALTLWVTSDAIKDQFFTDAQTGRLVKIAAVPISAELNGSSVDPSSLDVLNPGEYILVHASSPELKQGTHVFTAHAELVQVSNGKSELIGTADSQPATTTLSAASSN
jgi:Carboxypeptidase regulatory-like domain